MRSAYLEENSGVSDSLKKYEVITVARSLVAADSGKVFGIDQDSGAYEITLPLAATAGAGWNVVFINVDIGSNAVTIANNTAEDTILGFTYGGDGGSGSSAESAVDEIVFISGSQLGDRVDLFCDGVYFYASAKAHDVAHITIS